MGLLDGGLQAVMGAAFGGIYPAGTLYRATRTDALNGDVGLTFAAVPCRVQIEAVTEAMRLAPGYTEQSVRLRVLQAGVGNTPTTADEIAAGGTRWAISQVGSDTASTYWEMLANPA